MNLGGWGWCGRQNRGKHEVLASLEWREATGEQAKRTRNRTNSRSKTDENKGCNYPGKTEKEKDTKTDKQTIKSKTDAYKD